MPFLLERKATPASGDQGGEKYSGKEEQQQTEPSVFVIIEHWASKAVFLLLNLNHFHTQIPRQQQSRGELA